ncbi:MAG: restriction endonuclease subunit S [Acidimicrobiales bacterium]
MKYEILQDLVIVSAGYPLRGAVDALPTGDVAVIQMRNVDPDTGVNWAEARRVTLPSKRGTSFLAPGEIIFTTRGARNLALALDVIPGKAVCSPHFFVIRVKDTGRLMPEFLAWQMNQLPAQQHFQREATGSHILNIRREAIENLLLAVPSLARQQAITALAKAASAERAALSKLISNRNQQLDAIAFGLHHFERPRT